VEKKNGGQEEKGDNEKVLKGGRQYKDCPIKKIVKKKRGRWERGFARQRGRWFRKSEYGESRLKS